MARRALVALAAGLVLLTVPGPAVADGPAISVGGSGPTSTKVLTDGRVIDTFRRGEVEVRTIGAAAVASMPVNVVSLGSDQSGPHGSFSIGSVGGSFAKSSVGTAAGSGSTSAVDNLIALGVDPAIARRDFGDFDKPNGVASSDVTLASYKAPPPTPEVAPAVTPSSTVPYQTRCYYWNGVANGTIYGQGCSSVYVISASGGDWYLQNKFKATAWSTDTGFFFPVRLKTLSGDISWVSGNNVYDWDPSGPLYQNSCGNVTFGLAMVGEVSVTVELCPNKIVVNNLNSTSSGAKWVGNEVDNDPEGVAGWQEVHSPASAPATWSTGFSLTW